MRVLYVMSCGCVLREDELKSISTRTSLRVCPFHNGRIMKRRTVCKRCGEDVEQSKSGILSDYCVKHRKEVHNEVMRAYQQRKKEQKEEYYG